jgi:hypothetical protein
MPYQKPGTKNQQQWFLNDAEIQWLKSNLTQFPNRALFHQFNATFKCDMTYARMRHFMAQYDIKRCERGEKYTDAEKAYVRAHYETDPDCWMGRHLGRTAKSICRLRTILGLKRSPEAVKRLGLLRSASGARTLHERIRNGELQNPAQALTDGFISARLRRGTDLEADDLPQELIELSRLKIKMDRIIKKEKHEIGAKNRT